MYKIWFGLAFAAIVVSPASAQDYHKNWIECAKELGWQLHSVNKLSDDVRYKCGGGKTRRNRQLSTIVLHGKLVSRLRHPPRGSRDFHAEGPAPGITSTTPDKGYRPAAASHMSAMTTAAKPKPVRRAPWRRADPGRAS